VDGGACHDAGLSVVGAGAGSRPVAAGADESPAPVGEPVGASLDGAALLGVGLGEATGQVDDPGVAEAGEAGEPAAGTSVLGTCTGAAVPRVPDPASDGVGPVEGVGCADDVDAAEWAGFAPLRLGTAPPGQLLAAAVPEDTAPGRPAVPPPRGLAWAAGVVPPPSGVPFPSVPAPPRCVVPPPVSGAVLPCMIALRSGCMPSETLTRIAIPAAMMTAGRSHPVLRQERVPVCVSGRPLRCRGCGRRRSSFPGPGTSGQAQYPGQVQYLTRSPAPMRTATSQERGGRSPIRARMTSSPSALGSTPVTASDNACRSASSWALPSRPSSGAVMPSSASLPGHDVSCSRIDLSAVIARAVWLFTAPRLIPIALAISASEKSA
jgi:hypothetical protein